jgi:RHS repeat-associated protein
LLVKALQIHCGYRPSFFQDGLTAVDYLYDGWQVIREMRGSSSVDYTYGPRYIDEALAMHSTAGSYWYLRDQNMDVAGVTDASGSVVEKYSVGPYGDVKIADGQGNTLAASGVGNTRFFQGLEMVDGLYANRYRWVSPQLGRYVSRDPMGFNAGDVNLFRWVGNTPTNSLDPMGLLTLREAYILYYMGLGFPQTMDFSEVDFVKPDFSLFKGVTLPQKKAGACCEERSIPINKATRATNTKGEQKLFLGNITLEISGTMKISSNCCWEFQGRVKALPDEFDFQASTHRPDWAEFLTTVGRVSGNLLDAATYPIEFIGDRIYKDKGCAK